MSKLHDRRSNKWALLFDLLDGICSHYRKQGDSENLMPILTVLFHARQHYLRNNADTEAVELLSKLASATCQKVRIRFYQQAL